MHSGAQHPQQQNSSGWCKIPSFCSKSCCQLVTTGDKYSNELACSLFPPTIVLLQIQFFSSTFFFKHFTKWFSRNTLMPHDYPLMMEQKIIEILVTFTVKSVRIISRIFSSQIVSIVVVDRIQFWCRGSEVWSVMAGGDISNK